VFKRNKTVCPQGMQFSLAQVEQGKETVCVYLRVSAVKKRPKKSNSINYKNGQ
jgi:hypothetical protein